MTRTLSDDVRLVIDTLGFVIRAHAGAAIFEVVEAVRLAAKDARDADSAERGDVARQRLSDIVRSLDATTALEVARAFTSYFQLVNLAEDAERTRELRRREVEGGPDTVRDSIHGAMATAVAAGATREDALRALGEVALGFVFTAHPTEARRQTTERLLADVALVLRRRDRHSLTGLEVAAVDRRLRAAIEALFQHAAERTERPDVLDEVRAGLWYLRHVMLDAVPRFQRRLHHVFEAHFGPIDPVDLPVAVSFGSWMGGDRDGHPYVTAEVTARTLELHREIVLDRYAQDLDGLIDPLAAAAHRLPDHADLDAALRRAASMVPAVADVAAARNPREPMRRMLTLMLGRIHRTRSGAPGAYENSQEFLEDLMVLRQVLHRAHAVALPDDALLNLIHRVRCFGFRLAALDVREDSGVHRDVVGELLGDPAYGSWSPADRLRALDAVTLPEPGGRALSPLAIRLLELFSAIRTLQARFGAHAIGTYIISMTQSAADVIEVLRLAELHGIDDSLDIVPLLETPDDLANAGPTLEALFTDHRYASHLARRGRTQELLVGYSDSMKQGGMFSSCVRVAEAQRAAAAVCRRHNVRLRVFHGRGGVGQSRWGTHTPRHPGAAGRGLRRRNAHHRAGRNAGAQFCQLRPGGALSRTIGRRGDADAVGGRAAAATERLGRSRSRSRSRTTRTLLHFLLEELLKLFSM